MLLLCLALTAPLLAAAPQGFVITSFEVIGNSRVSDDLVVSQLGLKLETPYPERRLQLAERRLRRLPMILDASFSLRKGERYGTYQLVIHVEENTSFFYSVRRDYTGGDSPSALPFAEEPFGDISISTVPDERNDSEDNQLESIPFEDVQPGSTLLEQPLTEGAELNLGYRFALGTKGLAYVTTSFLATSDDIDFAPGEPVDAGLNFYGLGRFGAFVNLNVRYEDRFRDQIFDVFQFSEVPVQTEASWTPSLTLAVPIGINWFSFSSKFNESERAFEVFGDLPIQDRIEDRRWQNALSFFRNTTNDIVLPTNGYSFEVALRHVDLSTTATGLSPGDEFDVLSFFEIDGLADENAVRLEELSREEIFNTLDPETRALLEPITMEGNTLDIQADLFVAHPLNNRWSISGGAAGTYRLNESGVVIFDRELERWQVSAGIDRDLWGRRNTRRFGDMRLGLLLLHDNLSLTGYEEQRQTAELSLNFRNRWGLVRMSYQYRDRDITTTDLDLVGMGR
jgi:hypothetical protein